MKSPRKDKKRMFFLTGEDYYFYTYNIFIILLVLKCEKKAFKDHRKLAFMVDFCSGGEYSRILEFAVDQVSIKNSDINKLAEEYSTGYCRITEITRLLLALEKRGMIEIEKPISGLYLNVKLNDDKKAKTFFDSKYFEREFENIKLFKQFMPRVSSIKFETFLEKLYQSNGVSTWLTS